jgi:ribosome maturation factor RimP
MKSFSAVVRGVAFAGRLFLFWTTHLDGNEPTSSTSASDSVATTSLEGKLAAIIAPRLELMGFELVRVSVLGRERPTVQVMADRADGSQITVEDCQSISHDVSAAIDVDDPIPGAWTLEVSSAGIDRPLTRVKDWNRFAGHLVRAETFFPQNGRKRFAGVVLGADEIAARIRLDDGVEVAIRHPDIRRAKLVLTDALIEATAAKPLAN